jgi:hypothetical protein
MPFNRVRQFVVDGHSYEPPLINFKRTGFRSHHFIVFDLLFADLMLIHFLFYLFHPYIQVCLIHFLAIVFIS